MANRYFNKQTTNARQALAQGGSAKVKDDPRTTGGPRKGRPGPMGPGPKRPRRPSLQDLPKGGPKRKLKPFDNTDTTDREKITRDRIKRNEIKDRLDKLKQKMKVGPVGTGLNPDKLKKSIKNLKDQMGGKK
jgi:hypothetical protein